MRRAPLASTVLVLACNAGGDADDTDLQAGVDAEQAITFRAVVGDETWRCAANYENIGKTKATASFGDLKLYVHDLVALLPDGTEQPVELADDAPWQGEGVALLDLEDGTGSCAVQGDTALRSEVIGTFRDDAVGLRLTVGVPDALNVGPADDTSTPPLDRDDLLVNATSGFRYLRTVVITGGTGRWPVEIFDVWGTDPATGDPRELQDAQVQITLPGFRAADDAVLVDLAVLLSDSDPTTNFSTTPAGSTRPQVSPEGCQMTPGDQDCTGIFRHYGLGGVAADFLRVGPLDPTGP
ncbi:MAG: hypothetical protein H6732_08955 [Alphaproteobacteria bacterium]|nr:hypothetical protein [Alphaproteobacteria bacterium]